MAVVVLPVYGLLRRLGLLPVDSTLTNQLHCMGQYWQQVFRVGMRLSCNFVDVYTIAYRLDVHTRASVVSSLKAVCGSHFYYNVKCKLS